MSFSTTEPQLNTWYIKVYISAYSRHKHYPFTVMMLGLLN